MSSQQLTRGKEDQLVTLISSDGEILTPETCFAFEAKRPDSNVIKQNHKILSFTVKVGSESVTKVGKCPIHKGERLPKPTQGGGAEN